MKNKSIPCPECGKPISPQSQECTFCGKKVKASKDVEKKTSSLRSLYWAWLLTLGVFFLGFFAIRRSILFEESNLFGLTILIASVSAAAYIRLVLGIINSTTKKKLLYGLLVTITLISATLLYSNFSQVEAMLGFTTLEKPLPSTSSTPKPKPSLQPTTIPTPAYDQVEKQDIKPQNNVSNKIECIGPDGKTFQTTQKECDDFNAAWGNLPDQKDNDTDKQTIVHCHFSHGTYNLTVEQCDRAKQPVSGLSDYTYTPPPMPDYSAGNGYTYSDNSYAPNSNNVELQQACISDATRSIKQELQSKLSYLSANGLGGSAVERAERDAQRDIDRAISQCKSMYPTQ